MALAGKLTVIAKMLSPVCDTTATNFLPDIGYAF
jgi:hypothetical protein